MADKICFAIVRKERVKTFGGGNSGMPLSRGFLSFSTLQGARAWIRIC
jgi:hypothetical protein